MPMDVNSVVIYLAIVLAGHVVVSIADSFASTEIATRLKLSKAKAIFTQVSLLSVRENHTFQVFPELEPKLFDSKLFELSP